MLDEAAVTLLGVPTGPLGTAASLSTDASNLDSTPSLAAAQQDHRGEDGESVLIYCKGEPFPARLVGDGFALCRCGERVRVVW